MDRDAEPRGAEFPPRPLFSPFLYILQQWPVSRRLCKGGTGNRQANPCKSLVHIEPSRSAADLQLLFKGVECCEASLSQPKQQQWRRRRRQPNTRRRIGFGCVYYTKSVQPPPMSPAPPAACKLDGNGVYRVVAAAADTDCSSIYVLLGIPPTRRWRHASLYDRRSRRRCRRQPATARAFPPPPPLFRFCVWPTRRIETGGRCDSILDGTVALLAFAGMVVSSWLTLSTSNSAMQYSS